MFFSPSPFLRFRASFFVPIRGFSLFNQVEMRHNFALTFLLSLTVTFCATAQETFTHETLPPNAAVRKGEVTPSTTDFIRKSSAVMFNGRSDEWEIVRVPWDVFGIDDKTVLSRLNLTSDEWRETENCYRSCGLTIISDQSLRSDCQKAAQNNLSYVLATPRLLSRD